MSIYPPSHWPRYQKRKPFRTELKEYYDDVPSSEAKSSAERRIRVVTTTSEFKSGSSKGEPNTYVTYHYL